MKALNKEINLNKFTDHEKISEKFTFPLHLDSIQMHPNVI